MGWADACIDLSVFDRSQRLSLSLMSYNGAETRELGSAKITPALDAKETSRWLPLLGVNGRILYGRDGARPCALHVQCVCTSGTAAISAHLSTWRVSDQGASSLAAAAAATTACASENVALDASGAGAERQEALTRQEALAPFAGIHPMCHVHAAKLQHARHVHIAAPACQS
eukprot:Tamp_30927.p1 GENE.Tamp_30927~~Tamp_30927.p1  ORF type:complete len:180 (+),score=24.55 Tamp_30927:25-540(+)